MVITFTELNRNVEGSIWVPSISPWKFVIFLALPSTKRTLPNYNKVNIIILTLAISVSDTEQTADSKCKRNVTHQGTFTNLIRHFELNSNETQLCTVHYNKCSTCRPPTSTHTRQQNYTRTHCLSTPTLSHTQLNYPPPSLAPTIKSHTQVLPKGIPSAMWVVLVRILIL